VYSVLNKRRGIIVGEENRQCTPIYNVKAYLPVQESFGKHNSPPHDLPFPPLSFTMVRHV